MSPSEKSAAKAGPFRQRDPERTSAEQSAPEQTSSKQTVSEKNPTSFTDDYLADTRIAELLAEPEEQSEPPPYAAQDLIGGLFSPSWNLYSHKEHFTNSDYQIGPHKNQPLFDVNFGGYWKWKKTLTIKPLGGDELLADVKNEKNLTTQAVARVPSADYECQINCQYSVLKSTYSFVVPVPDGSGDSYPEKFEWRGSRGKEIKGLDKTGDGWKLVRLGKDATSAEVQAAAGRSDRPMGQSSDAKEVVAIYAENDSGSWSKYGKFRFISSGATGELGRTWAILCVASILRIFQIKSGEV